MNFIRLYLMTLTFTFVIVIMKSALRILFLIFISNVTCAKDLRIIGGENANIKDFPYMASIRLAENVKILVCGGTIISHVNILSAAHCFMEYSPTDIIVVVGSSNAPSYTDPFYAVKNILIHPEFVGDLETATTVHNDIAILTIHSCIPFNKFQNKIKLPSKDIKPGASAIVIGWGRINDPYGKTATVLQKASMTIVRNDDCGINLPFPVYYENVCAFQRERVGVCYGDSGGPLVSNGVLVGVSSFMRPCALGEPDIYTRVYAYLNFIKSNMFQSSKLFSCFSPSVN